MKKTDRIIEVILLLLFLVILHRGHFYPGTQTRGDWPFRYREQLATWVSLPYSWRPDVLVSTSSTMLLTFYPIIMTMGGLAKFLGFNYSLIEKIVFFFPVVFLPGISMYYLTHYLFKKRKASFFSAILYASNTFILLKTQTHLTMAMAYSLTPLILAFFIQSLRESSMRKVILASIVFAVSMAYEVRITYITTWLLLFYFLYINILERDFSTFKNTLKIFTVFTITTIALEAYWVLLYFLGGGRENFASRLPSEPWISWGQLIHAITLRTTWYTLTGEMKAFVVQPVNPIFLLIPILAFSAIFLRKKNKNVIFFSILALIGIFLVKQETPPYGFVYTWLFKNFPGFNQYRVAEKFYLLIALCYSVLYGVAVNDLGKVIGRKIKRQNTSKIAIICFFTLIFSSQIIMAWPALENQMEGNYYPSMQTPPKEYLTIKNFIMAQPSGYRTLWLPFLSRFSFFSGEYPTVPIDRLSQGDKTLLSALVTPPTVDSFYFSRLLEVWNIKFVILSLENELEHVYKRLPQEDYVEFLNNQQGLRRVHIGEGIYIYENTLYSQSRFYILKTEEEYFPREYTIDAFDFENGFDGWGINSVHKQKMFLSTISYSGEHSVGIELNISDAASKGIYSPLIPITVGNRYKWHFYVKGENAHKVSAWIFEHDSNGDRIGSYSMGAISDGTFDWIKKTIQFVTLSPNATHMRLWVFHGHKTTKPLPNKVWLDNVTICLSYSVIEADRTLKDMLSPIKKPAKVIEFTEVNPTKYIAKINAKSPFILTFSEPYDPLWIAKINGNEYESKPLYSMINGFWIEQTGNLEITIEYKPQTLFHYGILISLSSFIACLLFLSKDLFKNLYR